LEFLLIVSAINMCAREMTATFFDSLQVAANAFWTCAAVVESLVQGCFFRKHAPEFRTRGYLTLINRTFTNIWTSHQGVGGRVQKSSPAATKNLDFLGTGNGGNRKGKATGQSEKVAHLLARSCGCPTWVSN
jgi:hypothetical protein